MEINMPGKVAEWRFKGKYYFCGSETQKKERIRIPWNPNPFKYLKKIT
jgi:hypothetical protein